MIDTNKKPTIFFVSYIKLSLFFLVVKNALLPIRVFKVFCHEMCVY